MSGYNNHAYDPLTSLGKGAHDAGTTIAGGGIPAALVLLALKALDVELSAEEVGAAVGVIATVGGAAVQGFKRWRRNRRKHKPATSVPNVYGG